MAQKVIVLGGGVAGMSAAHELAERGFQVKVYEKKSIAGGKARSVLVSDTGSLFCYVPGPDGRYEVQRFRAPWKPGDSDLPGEHGFRFFPSFYRHVTDTMKRIPYGNNKQGVFDNLTNTTQIAITQFGKQGVLMLAQFPRSYGELVTLLKSMKELKNIGIEPGDVDLFASKLWQYLTMCQDRRMDDLEKIGWWEYIDASERSAAYQKFLAEGLTRSLVAANAHVANAKVEGDVGIQLILGLSEPGVNADRVLNGPTNNVWINPWLKYLSGKGVEYCLDTHIYSIECDGKTITGVTLLDSQGKTFTDTADYYILAVPVEEAARLLADKKQAKLLEADSTLKKIIRLGGDDHVAWMNGLQFYLKTDEPMIHGHMIHIDTPWSLTSISQSQFWTGFDWIHTGDGNVNGILSVDISEWDQKYEGKTAKECTREEIIKRVWKQLKESVNINGQTVLDDDDLQYIFIDPDIRNEVEDKLERSQPTRYKDAEPLYIDIVDSWHLRPDAYTRIPNFFLAADYVRTNTQLATMEGANEAARRAVNSIISVSGAKVPLCKIWPLDEPFMFKFWRWYDAKRYDRGEPWNSDFPWFIDVAQYVLVTAYQLWHNITGRKRQTT
jgi:uncharacterized protein with NAD-binding domain and iron-sulfur cluster